MSRTPAHITQADVARAVRAAKQAGGAAVEVRRDGTIMIHLTPQGRIGDAADDYAAPLAPGREIVF